MGGGRTNYFFPLVFSFCSFSVGKGEGDWDAPLERQGTLVCWGMTAGRG